MFNPSILSGLGLSKISRRPVYNWELSEDLLALSPINKPAFASTRTTGKTFTDYEGILRNASIDEPAFEGGRRVENLCTRSDPAVVVSLAYSSNISFQTGGITARGCANAVVVGDNSVQRAAYFTCPSMTINRVYLFSAVVKMNDNGVPVPGLLSTDANADFRCIIDATSVTYINPVVGLGNNEYLVSYYLNVGPTIGSPSAGVIKYTTNSTRGFLISGAQIEDITGSANTLPSEYILTTGAAKSKWFKTRPDGSPIYPAPKLLMEGQSQNKVTAKTANPVDLTGVTVLGTPLTLEVIDDSAALAAAGLSAICPSGKAYHITGTTVDTYSVFISGQPGNTNPHSASIYVRGTGTARFGMHGSTNLFKDNTALTSLYVKWKGENRTPPSSTQSLRLTFDAGQTVNAYFILPVFEESPVCTSVIPNDTGSPLTRTIDNCSTPLTEELKAMLSIDKKWKTSYANQTGLTWGADKNQSSFADGQSWFDHPDKDLSIYANSNKMIIYRDSAGRLAWGFIGAAGAGQTLGSELVVNGDFSADSTWIKGTSWTISGGVATCNGSVSGDPIYQTGLVVTVKKLHKLSLQIVTRSADGVRTVFNGGSTGIGQTMSATGQYDTFAVADVTPARMVIQSRLLFVGSIDNASVKEVLTPSSNGVYIYKDAARTLQGWNMEASFNMNDSSYTFDVVNDCKVESTVVLDLAPGYDGAMLGATVGAFLTAGTLTADLLYSYNNNSIYMYDGSVVRSAIDAVIKGVSRKIILRISSNTRLSILSYITNGVLQSGSAGSFDGNMPLGSVLALHKSNPLPAKYSGLKFFKRWLTDDELLKLV